MSLEIVRLPEERKAVLIGKEGKEKALIERKAGVKLRIGEDVEIEGDAEKVFVAKDVIKAVARGFSPRDALELLNDDCQLYIISLSRETEKTIKRLMGRVIGKGGASRRLIERETGARIAVMGKTVAIIGSSEASWKAREVVEDLIAGRTHAYIYNKLVRWKETSEH